MDKDNIMIEMPGLSGLPDLYMLSALGALSKLYDIIIAFIILVAFILAVSIKDIQTNKKLKDKDNERENNVLNMLSRCNNIFWGSLSSNPYAVDLLKKRFEYEKCLSDAEYKRLPFNHKINWVQISRNENAIELIKDRIEYEKSLGDEYKYQTVPYAATPDTYNKINWGNMTRNQNAIELLRERIKYEKSLSKEKYSSLRNRIDWIDSMGEANKNAIILLKDLLIE
jgi:hypothetical protein